MNDKQIIKVLNAMQALNKEQMQVFMFAANTYFQGLNDDTEEKEDEDDIDKIKDDLDIIRDELATTYNMVHKVYLGEAKIVYGVYTDGISFEDNDGEFLW